MVPGLYIEKGWVHESIDYSFTPPPEDKPTEPEVVEEEEEESGATNDSQGTRPGVLTSPTSDGVREETIRVWTL